MIRMSLRCGTPFVLLRDAHRLPNDCQRSGVATTTATPIPHLPITGRAGGPATQATASKNAGIEIFTIGFGVEDDTCSSDNSGSSYFSGFLTGL